MRKIFLSIISYLCQILNTWLVRCHLIKPIVVVGLDGGICSQMVAYLRGQYYAQVGVRVYYNLRWFETSGMDTYRKFERPFELLMAFPNLKLNQLSRFRTAFFQHFMRCEYDNNMMPDRETLTRSMYLSLYPSFRSAEDFRALVAQCFGVSARKAVNALEVPQGSISCAIHVRRGDMEYVSFKGYNESSEYFIDAVKYVKDKYRDIKFFLFSDEPEWVQEKILPFIKGANMEMVSGNLGHEDLLLAAQCPVIIGSQGTMGRMAALLNSNSELILPSTGDWGAFHVENYREVTRFPLVDAKKQM